MRIVLCDDDEQILKLLKKYLREYFQSAHLSQPDYTVYTSGDDLLVSEAVPSAPSVDIAFLDVEMSGRNGINTGALLKEKNPKIKIFIVTSYLDYLDDAMKFHVFRYLLKPINKVRLFRNMSCGWIRREEPICLFPSSILAKSRRKETRVEVI